MSPSLRSLLARASLLGGVALVATIALRTAPHEQNIVVRFAGRQVQRVTGVVTRQGETEPIAGFSRDFPQGAPRSVRHTFSAPNDTYIVDITLQELPSLSASPNDSERSAPTGASAPIPSETTFERRVSLAGGEVIISPD